MDAYNNSINRIASLTYLVRLLSFILLLIFSFNSFAQNKSKEVEIVDADLLLTDETIDAERLIGNVVLKHNNIILKCDSAWNYTLNNVIDAFGNVHIISNDTLNMWANFIRYNTDNEIAKARRKVVLTNPSLTLTTDSLDFDMKNNIGYYNYNGTIVDSTNTLTSIIGRYYTKENKMLFIDSVKVKNEKYTMTSDTMIYYTETEIIEFEGPTKIIGDSTYVYSTSGWFNTKTNETELNRNSTIRRGDTQLQADYIFYNDNNGEGEAKNHVIINDFGNSMIIVGNKAVYNDFEQYAMVTDSALWIQYFDGDSLFLHADTLYSMPDTSVVDSKLLKTYRDVRFYRTDIQGICDSLIYFTKDSTIQLYNDPVLWSNENQMTADFIEFKNKSDAPNEIYLTGNSFTIQQVDSSKFNQIKGKNMIGFINGEFLYRIDVNGNGQSIYYPEDSKEFIGVNKAESSNIILYLAENQINRITFVGTPVGKMKPLLGVVSEDTELPGFKWRENERPRNRYDLFGINGALNNETTLPASNIIKKLPDIQSSKKKLDNEWNKLKEPTIDIE